MRVSVILAAGVLLALACSSATDDGDGDGSQYHLGPVDWEETQWHNGCAPPEKYPSSIRAAEGSLLAGLWRGVADVTQYCDACIRVVTERGRSAVLRVVTYGDTSPNSIDVSPDAYVLLNAGEYPRKMTWEVTACPDAGSVIYEFRDGSTEWWTSFWVRVVKWPIAKVEVKSANHPDFVTLARGDDGALTDAAGFGQGPFTIRSTAVNGHAIEDTFDWPASGIAGQLLQGRSNVE
jgi:hypothetical protein